VELEGRPKAGVTLGITGYALVNLWGLERCLGAKSLENTFKELGYRYGCTVSDKLYEVAMDESQSRD